MTKLLFILLFLFGCAVKEINYDGGIYKGKVKENLPG